MSGFFWISKTQNLSIDLNIELYVSVISLYDVDTVSPVRVEIWKENMFSFFYAYHFVELSFIFVFIFVVFLTPPHAFFKQKKLITITLFMIFNKNGAESDWKNTRILTYVTKKSLIFYWRNQAASNLRRTAARGLKSGKTLTNFEYFCFRFYTI